MKTIKLEYTPGNRPAPMIMVQNQINPDVFNEKYENEFGKWNNDKSTIHFWSINAYIIIENNKIISYRYNEIINLIWILRIVNKKLIIEIADNIFKNEISKNFEDEFKVIK